MDMIHDMSPCVHLFRYFFSKQVTLAKWVVPMDDIIVRRDGWPTSQCRATIVMPRPPTLSDTH